MELVPVPNVTGGMMLFGWERAREVVQAWREWTAGAPETATTSCRIMQVPDMPTLPEFVRGRGVVIIDGAVLAGASEAAAILAPLRALEPELDTFAEVPPVALSYIHMDPEDPMPSVSEHAMLHALTEQVVDDVVDGFGPGSGSPLLMVEFRHAGGALARPGSGALACLPGEYVMFACNAAIPELAEANATAFARLRETVADCATDRVYHNFAEQPYAPEVVYGEASATRLRAVRTAYDPDGLFAGAQSF